VHLTANLLLPTDDSLQFGEGVLTPLPWFATFGLRCISVGTRRGFAIYNCEPFGKCFQEDIGGIGIAEMLYCTSLVALVGAGEQVGCMSKTARLKFPVH
jgi:hypothetical protein